MQTSIYFCASARLVHRGRDGDIEDEARGDRHEDEAEVDACVGDRADEEEEEEEEGGRRGEPDPDPDPELPPVVSGVGGGF